MFSRFRIVHIMRFFEYITADLGLSDTQERVFGLQELQDGEKGERKIEDKKDEKKR